MDNHKNVMKRPTALMIALLVVTAVIGALGGEAFASAQCVAGGGQQVGGERIVLSGLQPGERVVVDGLQHIAPDVKVQAKEEPAAAAPETPSAH